MADPLRGRRAAWAAAGALLLATLTGCGGDQNVGKAEQRATHLVTVTATATATSTPTPTEASTDPAEDVAHPVKPVFTCTDLFGKSHRLGEIADFWNKDSVTIDEIDDTYRRLDKLAEIATHATEEYRTLIQTVVDETTAYLEFIQAASGPDYYDTTLYKRAGRQLTNSCLQVIEGHADTRPAKPKPTKPPKPEPVIVPGDGVFEVGKDVPPGTYRSPGSKGPGYYCVVYASRKPSDLGSYLRGSTVEGPTIITVNVGEYLNTQFCKPFKKD